MSVLLHRKGSIATARRRAVIDTSYFGTHILGPLETNLAGSGISMLWPSWMPTTLRLWNTYGYNSTKAVYEGILWGNIATANGVYDWTLFDALLAKYIAMGVTDVLYTFGLTPAWAGGGANGGQAPTSMQYLTDFATAVANRAVSQGFPITHWETWNEPNNGAPLWTGTNAQMVSMAQAIYNALKTVNSNYQVLTPCPQGYATAWMDSYLAAGGGAYADIMAFHGYTSQPPENIITLIDNYKTVFATYGQSTKPIWNTESFDWRATVSDPTLQAKFLATYYLLHKVKGIDRFYWYTYDEDIAHEWAYNEGLNAIATADVQLHNWMIGATVGPLTINSTVYSVLLSKGAQQALAVWDAAGTSAYSTGSYTNYTTLLGVTNAISGGTVSIGQSPILLQ